MTNLRISSILDMARGAIKERMDYEMARAIKNIQDPNTKPTAKRTVTLSLSLTPDETRTQIQVSVTAKSTLVPTNPVSTSLCVTEDFDGNAIVAELVPQVPGQLTMDGAEVEAPKVLKLNASVM